MSFDSKCYTLEQLAKIKYGKNQIKVQDNVSGVYPIYGTGGLMGYSNEYLYNKASVLIGRKGSIRKVKYVEHPFWTVDTLFYTEINEKLVYPKFLYYKMSLIDFEYYNEGTTVPSLRTDTLNRIEFYIPSLKIQKAIVNILSCLDDKIYINNLINKTLEEMAQAIFKSWFVDFEPFQDGEFEDSELGRIPKGWKVGTLSDISNITMGQSPSGSSYNENNDGTVFYQGRTDFGKRYPTVRLYTTEPKRMANKGDILLSVRAPVGDINVASENCCIGRGLAALKSKNNCNSYLLYLLLNLKEAFKVYNGEGTIFGSINKDALNNMQVLIPSEKDIRSFQDTVGKFDEMFENNIIQIQKLISIRDSLLPKLMRGEIRVPLSS